MTQFDCTDIKALLSAIVDDELEPDDRHLVERHLAGCSACRSILDEAEAVDALLAEEAERPGKLPVGFEDFVLAQTVRADHLRLRGRRWVTAGGWLACAAALGLAMTIWIVDRRALVWQPANTDTDSVTPIDPGSRLSYASSINNSWIYEGPVAPAAMSAPDLDVPATTGAPPTIERIMQSAALTREDAEAIYAAALALDQLRGADERSFADLDQVRRIVEYDELLAKLAGAHSRLSAEDRAAVLAAESIFARIVRGPVSAADLVEMGAMIVTLELPERLMRIARRSDATMSL